MGTQIFISKFLGVSAEKGTSSGGFFWYVNFFIYKGVQAKQLSLEKIDWTKCKYTSPARSIISEGKGKGKL